VIEAALPHEALRLAQQYDGSIDFLMTDVIMSKMNGLQASQSTECKMPRNQGPVRLRIHGWFGKDGVYGVLEEGLAFLQKPYTRHALTRKVREILDSAPAKARAQSGVMVPAETCRDQRNPDSRLEMVEIPNNSITRGNTSHITQSGRAAACLAIRSRTQFLCPRSHGQTSASGRPRGRPGIIVSSR
jgi:hypothetical protein